MRSAVCGTVGTGSFACKKPFSPSPPSRHSLPPRLPAQVTCRCTCERSRSAARSLAAAQPSQHFNMLAVHWIGTGTVAYRTRTAARDVAALARRGRRQPDRCLARREPRLDRRVGRSSVPRHRDGAAAPVVRDLVARHRRARPRALAGRHAGDRDAGSVGRERGDRARSAVGRARGAACGRSTTPPARTRYTRAQAAGDRARDRGLPRAGKRLERHRLQLSRRPLRHGLRRSGRRRRAERDRRARAKGSTPGRPAIALLGNYIERRSAACAAERAREAARVASRRRARRPALDGRLHVGRQREVPRGQGRDAAGDLRPSRHGAERVPRRPRLRAAAGARAARRPDRAAEAVLADGDRRRWAARSGSRRGSPPRWRGR